MITVNGKNYQLNWIYVRSSSDIDYFHIISKGTNYEEIDELIQSFSSTKDLIITTDKQDNLYNHFTVEDYVVNTHYGVQKTLTLKQKI